MLKYEVRTYSKYITVNINLQDRFQDTFLNIPQTKELIGNLRDLINELESKLENLPE